MKNAYKRLVIDTATSYLYLALVYDNQEISSVYQEGKHDHSVTIIPLMDQMLSQNGIELQDINEVIVGIGPGSYTGVRIGVSIAKMIGYLNDIKVCTVSSLLLLASSSDLPNVVPFIDARRGNAFMSWISQNAGLMKVVKEDVLMNAEEFVREIHEKVEIILYGKPNIEKVIASNALSPVANIHDLVPNYLQITEAERHLRSQ